MQQVSSDSVDRSIMSILLSDLQGDDKEQTERNRWTDVSGSEESEGVKTKEELHLHDL
jgi:hypothetical protein